MTKDLASEFREARLSRSYEIVIRISLLLALLFVREATAQPMMAPPKSTDLAPRLTGPTVSVILPLNGFNRKGEGVSRRALLEMGAVVLTGAGHLAFSAADASAAFIPIAAVGWGSYIVYRTHEDPDFLRQVGLTSENLGPAFRDASLVAAGSLALMAGAAAAQGSLRLHRDMAPALLLYPAWGLLQQFLVQGLVAGNLRQTSGWAGSPYFITPVTAAVFGSVHLPNWMLTAGTSALGLMYTPLYLKHNNLWPLGLYHGWLGTFYYFWVLDRNPWTMTVGG